MRTSKLFKTAALVLSSVLVLAVSFVSGFLKFIWKAIVFVYKNPSGVALSVAFFSISITAGILVIVAEALHAILFILLSSIANSMLLIRDALLHIPNLVRVALSSGWSLRRLTGLCFSEKTWIEVFEPALSDMRKEHNDELAAGRPWQARIALVRGYWAFWLAVFAQLSRSFAQRVYGIWR